MTTSHARRVPRTRDGSSPHPLLKFSAPHLGDACTPLVRGCSLVPGLPWGFPFTGPCLLLPRPTPGSLPALTGLDKTRQVRPLIRPLIRPLLWLIKGLIRALLRALMWPRGSAGSLGPIGPIWAQVPISVSFRAQGPWVPPGSPWVPIGAPGSPRVPGFPPGPLGP